MAAVQFLCEDFWAWKIKYEEAFSAYRRSSGSDQPSREFLDKKQEMCLKFLDRATLIEETRLSPVEMRNLQYLVQEIIEFWGKGTQGSLGAGGHGGDSLESQRQEPPPDTRGSGDRSQPIGSLSYSASASQGYEGERAPPRQQQASDSRGRGRSPPIRSGSYPASSNQISESRSAPAGSKNCDRCEVETASLKCGQCDAFYCTPCSGSVHLGRLAQHKLTSVQAETSELCDRCSRMDAELECLDCVGEHRNNRTFYCSTCSGIIHKGRIANHDVRRMRTNLQSQKRSRLPSPPPRLSSDGTQPNYHPNSKQRRISQEEKWERPYSSDMGRSSVGSFQSGYDHWQPSRDYQSGSFTQDSVSSSVLQYENGSNVPISGGVSSTYNAAPPAPEWKSDGDSFRSRSSGLSQLAVNYSDQPTGEHNLSRMQADQMSSSSQNMSGTTYGETNSSDWRMQANQMSSSSQKMSGTTYGETNSSDWRMQANQMSSSSQKMSGTTYGETNSSDWRMQADQISSSSQGMSGRNYGEAGSSDWRMQADQMSSSSQNMSRTTYGEPSSSDWRKQADQMSSSQGMSGRKYGETGSSDWRMQADQMPSSSQGMSGTEPGDAVFTSSGNQHSSSRYPNVSSQYSILSSGYSRDLSGYPESSSWLSDPSSRNDTGYERASSWGANLSSGYSRKESGYQRASSGFPGSRDSSQRAPSSVTKDDAGPQSSNTVVIGQNASKKSDGQSLNAKGESWKNMKNKFGNGYTFVKNKCPLYGCNERASKTHANESHFPWYVCAGSACWKCKIQLGRQLELHSSPAHPVTVEEDDVILWGFLVCGALFFVAEKLGFKSLYGLYKHCLQKGMYPTNIAQGHFSSKEHELIRQAQTLLPELVFPKGKPGSSKVYPASSSIMLTHFVVLSKLLGHLKEEDQKVFATYYQPTTPEGKAIPAKALEKVIAIRRQSRGLEPIELRSQTINPKPVQVESTAGHANPAPMKAGKAPAEIVIKVSGNAGEVRKAEVSENEGEKSEAEACNKEEEKTESSAKSPGDNEKITIAGKASEEGDAKEVKTCMADFPSNQEQDVAESPSRDLEKSDAEAAEAVEERSSMVGSQAQQQASPARPMWQPQLRGLSGDLEDKDMMEAMYKMHLVKSLLNGTHVRQLKSTLPINKLKEEWGSDFARTLECMFEDVVLSGPITIDFMNFLHSTAHSGIGFSVLLLRKAYWPTYIPEQVKLTPEMLQLQHVFTAYYRERDFDRKLEWQPSLGVCEMRAYLPSKEGTNVTVELIASMDQALCLLLFNSGDEFRLRDFKKATAIEDGKLRRTLQYLKAGEQILVKTPRSKYVEDEDVFKLNSCMTRHPRAIKLNGYVMKSVSPEEKSRTEERVIQDRKLHIHTAIVRILRARKMLYHEMLMAELSSLLRFVPQPLDVMTCIECLISRNYMEKDQKNSNIYHYIA